MLKHRFKGIVDILMSSSRDLDMACTGISCQWKYNSFTLRHFTSLPSVVLKNKDQCETLFSTDDDGSSTVESF